MQEENSLFYSSTMTCLFEQAAQRKVVYRRLTVLVLLQVFSPYVFSRPVELLVRNIVADQCKILDDAHDKAIWIWKGILYSFTNFCPKEMEYFPV